MKENLKFSLTLFIICGLAASLLSMVYAVTEPKIAQQREEKEQSAINEVMPQAKEIRQGQADEITYYEAKNAKGEHIGYIFITQKKGYSSDIRIAVSMDKAGRIILVKVLEQNETPGIGSQITEDSFLSKFKNRYAESLTDSDAISGATISSSALIEAIKEAAAKILEGK